MAEGRAPRAAGKAAKTGATAAAKAASAVNNGAGDVVEEAVTDGAATLRGVSEKSGTLGMGFMGLALSLWSGAYAYSKFRQALGKPVVPVPAPPTE